MYEQHFGLAAKPFQLSPDTSFFYPSREHKRALSFLEYGLDQADGFIVITGDVGTGKTTVVQTLLQDLPADKLLVASIATTQLHEDDLLRMVAAKFGLEIAESDKASVLRDLEEYFILEAEQGYRALLVVDEAQNLPQRSVEELRMLSNFQYNGRPMVQIFLLGQGEFRATLLSQEFEQLRQRVIATYHLNPLDEEETRTYIEHRLQCAGYSGRPEISDSAFQSIFESTDGVPRRINNLCDRILLFAFLEELDRIDSIVVEKVSRELGSEFSLGAPTSNPRSKSAEDVFNKPGEALESMARSLFDKADLQNRVHAIEHSMDHVGTNLKMDIMQLKDEVIQVRRLLERLVQGRDSGNTESMESMESMESTIDSAVPITSKKAHSPKIS